MQLTASWFLVVVSLAAAFGFMVYGGRLVAMLCRFPLESRGRTKKMHEVRLPASTPVCFRVEQLDSTTDPVYVFQLSRHVQNVRTTFCHPALLASLLPTLGVAQQACLMWFFNLQQTAQHTI